MLGAFFGGGGIGGKLPPSHRHFIRQKHDREATHRAETHGGCIYTAVVFGRQRQCEITLTHMVGASE